MIIPGFFYDHVLSLLKTHGHEKDGMSAANRLFGFSFPPLPDSPKSKSGYPDL